MADLDPSTLIDAYRRGLFPMLVSGMPGVLGWWSPDPRGILEVFLQAGLYGGFITAETVAYQDLVQCGSIAAAREKGLYRMEGKEYVVVDGDVMLFKFNV